MSFQIDLLRDLRQSLRSLARVRGYTMFSVLTLALGFGASTAIYSLLEKVVLDPLPYPELDRLVRLKNLVPAVSSGAEWDFSTTQYHFLRQESEAIDAIAAFHYWASANVQTPDGPEHVSIATITASTLDLIGARAVAGRLFDDDDDTPTAPPIVVLSWGFWQRGFGGRADIVGQTLLLDGWPHDVIGVAAPNTHLPPERGSALPSGPDLWVPMRLSPSSPLSSSHVIPMFARLRAGVTIEQAQTELERLTTRLPDAFPAVYSQQFIDQYGFRARLYPLAAYSVGSMARNLWILFGGVAFVLLIAGFNVANLFLVRMESRRHEMAIRAALGAQRRALAWSLLRENLVLCTMAGIFALAIGYAAVRSAESFALSGILSGGRAPIDFSIVLFTVTLAILVAVTLTALPFVVGRDTNSSALMEGGRSVLGTGPARQRLRSAFVVLQVALALTLLVGAGLLIESYRRMRAAEPGIDTEHVLTAALHVSGDEYRNPGALWRFYEGVLDRVGALPGVAAVGMTTELPFKGGFGCTVQGFEDARVYERLASADNTACAGQQPTTAGYFEAMGIPLVAGRTFTDVDHDPAAVSEDAMVQNAATVAPVAVVSRAFAERFWPGEDPIGKGIAPNGRRQPPFHRVVGVVGDVYSNSVDEDAAVVVYYPAVHGAMRIVVRSSSGNPLALTDGVRQAVSGIDANVPLDDVQSTQALFNRSMIRTTFLTTLLAIAAGIALFLAAIGLAGVVSYIVSQRASEIGVRMALGARPQQVRAMLVRGALRLTALGIALGLVAALLATRVLERILFGVQPTQPVAYVGASAVLLVVAAVASAAPAQHATRIDAARALRSR